MGIRDEDTYDMQNNPYFILTLFRHMVFEFSNASVKSFSDSNLAFPCTNQAYEFFFLV